MNLANTLAMQDIRRAGRVITAKRRPPLMFDPDFAIKEHVTAAASKLTNHFAGESESGKGMRKPLRTLLEDARLLGFEDAAEYSGKKLTNGYANKVARESKEKSRELARQINKTTRKGLESESPYITSSDRALTIASHEGRKAYFEGLMEGMGGNGFGKSWITADAPCDACTDNEDDDVIDIDDVFTSGDYGPPAHPNCKCMMGINV